MKTICQNAIVMFLTLLMVNACDSSNRNLSGKQLEDYQGNLHETEYFNITIAEGFNTLEIQGGVQASRGRDAMEVWVRGHNLNESTAENQAKTLARNYYGSEPEVVQMLDLTFYCTSFEAYNLPQTICTAIKEGMQVQVGITGKNHAENAKLQGMVKSISMK